MASPIEMPRTGDEVARLDRPERTARLERQLEAAQQITHIGSWEWDLATGSVTWSDERYRIYGVPPRSTEITLDWFLSRVHPEDRERIQADIRAALQRGGRFAYRERILRPDGSVRELDTMGEVLTGPLGAPTGLLGTCRDITEDRRLEETIRLYADVVDHVQLGLSVWRQDRRGDPASLRLVAYNRASEVVTGVKLAGAIGKTLPVVFPDCVGTELPALLAGVDEATPMRQLAAYHFAEGPAPTFAVKAFALPDRCVGLVLEDVTERVRAVTLQAGERRVLEMLASGASLAEILTAIVELIEALVPPTAASIVLIDDGGRIRHGAAPSLPPEYVAAIEGVPVGPDAGSCGAAAYLGEPVLAIDTATDPRWARYRDMARQFGLRACWSHPIFASDRRVLGTFAMYYREPRAPDAAALQLIERAAHVAGIVIERRRLDDDLRALSARIEAIREDERTGIAREVHDELGQAMTALKMDLAWLQRRLPGPAPVVDKLGEMSRMTDEIIHAVRRISAELRPGILDDLGLQAAIEWQAEEFERRTGTSCVVEAQLGNLQLERGLATAVFRIFQEALTNVVRHASAGHVSVRLGLERGQLALDVADDGVGISDRISRSGSFGLLGMRERARRLGGDCVVTSRPEGGTLVSLRVPLRFPVDGRTDTDAEMGA